VEDLKDVQRAVFQQQILLANDLGLPVNVHSRSAGHHAVKADRLARTECGTVQLQVLLGVLLHKAC